MVTPDPRRPSATGLHCRGCGGDDPRRVVSLGSQPASDDFPRLGAPRPDDRWPLELWWCPECTLVQLGPVEARAEEAPLAIESRTSRDHARQSAAELLAEYPQLAGASVREFASHHGGSWLEALADHGCRPVPQGRRAQLVIDVHGLAHEGDLGAELGVRAGSLAVDGILVVEFHHLLQLVQEGQFDTVRHGHWSYLSLTAMARLTERLGLRVIRAVSSATFGGSLRLVLAHARSPLEADPSVPRLMAQEERAGLVDATAFAAFEQQAHVSAEALRGFLARQRSLGRRVLGYGAPSKAAVLLGLSGIGTDLLEFTVDAAPLKHGLAIPGPRIPIRPVADLVAAEPDMVLVLTWDIVDEVVTQLESGGQGWGAEYALPLPMPHVLDRPRPSGG